MVFAHTCGLVLHNMLFIILSGKKRRIMGKHDGR